jgi:tRNA(Ile)-lysidine synthase
VLTRETVRAAVPAGYQAWEDPHNSDLAFARARVRHRVLPALEAELGPGIAAALARTADLLRADADALDAWADRALTECMIEGASVGVEPQQTDFDRGLNVGLLAAYPTAVRRRVLRKAAIAAGSPASDLTAEHVEAMDALIARWRGQVGVDLPGKLRARRVGGVIGIGPPD